MPTKEYRCPYCGREIGKTEILFWTETDECYPDQIRTDFLRLFKIEDESTNNLTSEESKKGRLYFKPIERSEDSEGNIVERDDNGYPEELSERLSNGIKPDELNKLDGSTKQNNSEESNNYDDVNFGDQIRRTQQPTSVQKDGRQDEKITITGRACPYCHCILPEKFGSIDTYHVAMYGGRAAGKTSFLINLLQIIEGKLEENHLGLFEILWESKLYYQKLIDTYQSEGYVYPTARDATLMPLVTNYKNTETKKEAYFIFYDIAGENTTVRERIANHKGIALCDTLMVMIDPSMFDSGQTYNQFRVSQQNMNSNNADEESSAKEYCTDSFDKLCARSLDYCGRYCKKLKNVICVITKLDMLCSAYPECFIQQGANANTVQWELLENTDKKHLKAIDDGILKKVEFELLTFYEKKFDKGNLINDVIKGIKGDRAELAIENCCLLGVSTHAVTHNNGQFIVKQNTAAVTNKHRIEEPYYALLKYYGLAPVKNDASVIIGDGDDQNSSSHNSGKRWLFGRKKKH